MSQAAKVILKIEKLGGRLSLEKGGAIHYRLPKQGFKALLEEIRREWLAVEAHLRTSGVGDPPGKHPEKPDSGIDDFDQAHLGLPQLIGQRVWTLSGVGTLVTVLSDDSEVYLHGSGKKIRMSNRDIRIIQ